MNKNKEQKTKQMEKKVLAAKVAYEAAEAELKKLTTNYGIPQVVLDAMEKNDVCLDEMDNVTYEEGDKYLVYAFWESGSNIESVKDDAGLVKVANVCLNAACDSPWGFVVYRVSDGADFNVEVADIKLVRGSW